MWRRVMRSVLSRRLLSTLSKDQERVLTLLRQLTHPKHQHQDIVFSGSVRNVSVKGNEVAIAVALDQSYRQIKHDILEFLPKQLGNDMHVRVHMAEENKPSVSGYDRIKHVIAVSSCKGGVGKSTVAVNLAYALSSNFEKRVGIFDADIYGPSLPTMVHPSSLKFKEASDGSGRLLPLDYLGVKLMSYGFLQSGNGAAVMRGPMVTNLLSQILRDVEWGELDYLVVDMPPGTGDIQITLTQMLRFSGAVIVTTPQKLSYVDVEKGIRMFDAVKVPTLNVVENMSYLRCLKCGEKQRPFGKGRLQGLMQMFGLSKGFELPLQPDVSEFGDKGTPFILQRGLPGTSETQDIFVEIAKHVDESCLNDRITTSTIRFDSLSNKVIVALDGEETFKLDPFELRLHCRCALCIDEISGQRTIQTERIPKTVRPEKVSARGNYAVSVVWSDGHASSIYTFEFLKTLKTM